MTLRSRKAGEKEKRSDVEVQHFDDGDAALRKLHMETEVFNFKWREFLFRISIALIFYSAFVLYQHIDNIDHILFDSISIAYYVCSSIWLREAIGNHEFSFMSNTFFRLSLVLTSMQLMLFVYETKKGGSMGNVEKEYVPTTCFVTLIVFGNLLFMNNSSKSVETTRRMYAEATKLKSR